jgi:hypothetical protein
MNRFQIPRLLSGGIITNYFCTSRCRHCLYKSGPHWAKTYIDKETALENFKIIREMGCASVHIGGGEPMLRPDALADVLDAADREGIVVEYVETNGSWFQDMDTAERTLTDLQKKGLKTLLVSISPFHNEFIPFSKTKGVIEAARKARVGIFPWIDAFYPDLAAFEADRTHDLKTYTAHFGENYLGEILRRYWIHMGGRALETFRNVVPTRSYREILDQNQGGCVRELTDTGHFHIDLFGNYVPGLCSGLAIDANDLGKSLSREKYPLITLLANTGINGFFAYARSNYGFSPSKKSYINKCDLCNDIRSGLVERDYHRSAELNPKGFYSDHAPMPRDIY